MACFAVPAALGAATTVFSKRLPARWRVGWLNAMIWGGSAALAVEHVAHGELVPWPPFFTAMSSPANAAAMLHELATVGVPMTIALILAWVVLVLAYDKLAAPKPAPENKNIISPVPAMPGHKLGFLALMLCGAFVMVFVDNAAVFLNGRQLIEYGTNGLIINSLALGVAMLIPIMLIWLAALRMPLGAKPCPE